MISADLAAFLLLGNALFCSAYCCRVPKGVKIDGCDVGGLSFSRAEKCVRENLYKRLSPIVIHAPTGDLILEKELVLRDNASALVRSAKRGECLSLSYSREFPDLESVLYELCEKNARQARSAELSFSERGFSYSPHTIGVACDYHKLVSDVTALLPTGGEATLSVKNYSPSVTEETLKKRTRLLSSFTTCFDGDNLPRSHNIALAASRISGTVLNPGEEFSFNGVVGERTAENGFHPAPVIMDGEYVQGVGGGVCQASSTLFGCILRGGLKVRESHPHSLPIGYVPPSLDAMVSSASDLRFYNAYPFPVYLLGRAGRGSVSFFLYGMPDGKKYETESVVLSKIPPGEDEIVEGERGVLREGKEGVLSESYLLVYDEGGALLSRTRIRRDCYLPTRRRVGNLPAEEQIPFNEGELPLFRKENFISP